MKIKINKKYLYLIGGIILFSVIVFLQTVSKIKNQNQLTVPILPPVSTPAAEQFITDYNPNEATKAWNDAYQNQLDQYVASRNATADAALSQIRQSSPIVESGFKIEYNYDNSTYTITLSPPIADNKQKVLQWFANQGITQKILDGLRLKWITAL